MRDSSSKKKKSIFRHNANGEIIYLSSLGALHTVHYATVVQYQVQYDGGQWLIVCCQLLTLLTISYQFQLLEMKYRNEEPQGITKMLQDGEEAIDTVQYSRSSNHCSLLYHASKLKDTASVPRRPNKCRRKHIRFDDLTTWFLNRLSAVTVPTVQPYNPSSFFSA